MFIQTPTDGEDAHTVAIRRYVRPADGPSHAGYVFLVKNSSPRVILFTLWLLVFSSASQTMIVSPILPQIGDDLGIADAVLGTLVTAYSLMVGMFAILSGPVSDRIGRRRILLIGCAAMTVALGLHGLVDSYVSFLVVRVFTGMAGGVLSGAAVSYIGDYFPYERRGWATGWVMSGAAFGQIVGIPMGMVMAERWGFRCSSLCGSVPSPLC